MKFAIYILDSNKKKLFWGSSFCVLWGKLYKWYVFWWSYPTRAGNIVADSGGAKAQTDGHWELTETKKVISLCLTFISFK